MSGFYNNGGGNYRNYNNNNNGGGYNRNYNNNGGGNYNNGGGNYRGNNNGGKPPKHTGCKSGVDRNGKQYIRGWNASQQHGMVTFYCSPTGSTGDHKSKSGRVWQNWMVKVQPKFQQEYLTSGLYDSSTGKLTIPSMGIVLNPKTDYCGRFGKKK